MIFYYVIRCRIKPFYYIFLLNRAPFSRKNVHFYRYFAAETELQWYIDGFEFEPQRDRVVVRELRIPLREEFRANVAASKDQFVFLVLLKVGHRVEASDVLWMAPDDREIVVKGLWSHGIFKVMNPFELMTFAPEEKLIKQMHKETICDLFSFLISICPLF